jgi:death on curing protein
LDEIVFLTPEEVVELHGVSIKRFSGESGLRDAGLMESAVMALQQTFDGDFLYHTIYEMAAALWHGLVCNHPFVDGNKRVGALAADVFLLANGIEMTFENKDVIELTLRLATSSLSRSELADMIARNTRLLR